MNNVKFGMWSLLLAGLIVVFAVGCSGGAASPTLPQEGTNPLAQTQAVGNPSGMTTVGHGTWGHYTMVVDERDMSVKVVPDRSTDTHYNVTWVKDVCSTCIAAKVKISIQTPGHS